MSRCLNLADLYEVVADTCPDRTALVADEPPELGGGRHRLTYAELDARANRLAHALRAAGVAEGEHVAVLAYNRAEWVETMIGCFKIRAAPVNVNYRYVASELAHLIADADAVALIGERSLLARVAEIRHRLPQLRHVLVLEDGDDTDIPEAVSYEEALAGATPDRDFAERSPEDPYVLYTGGTTGLPKGVLWRSADIFVAAMGGGSYGGPPITDPEELATRVADEPLRYQVHAPLMHGGGQWVTWIALTTGNTAILWTRRRFDADAALALAQRERANILMVVGNGMAQPIADTLAADPAAYDLSSVVALGSGGAPLSPAVRETLTASLPNLVIRDHLGVSETGAVGQSTDPGEDGVARFSPGPEFAVLDEDLRPVDPGSGDIGVLARTGHIPLGYYNDPEKTAKTFTVDPHGVRWALQGDYARVEVDGTIGLLGRGSLVINTGGEKVYAEEVEGALRTHPAVSDAVVTGVDDPVLGQRVAAVVAVHHGAALTDNELAAYCRSRVAGYKVPRTVRFADEVRRTPVGKPDYGWARSLLDDLDGGSARDAVSGTASGAGSGAG